jgi:hypothetical protein
VVSCRVIFHLRVKTQTEPPITPPPNAEPTPSPLPIQQVNLVPADHEAEPSLLFDQPDTAKKRKGKGKEKAQPSRWFESLPSPQRNVCYFLFTYSRKIHYRPRWRDPADTNISSQCWLRRRKPKMQWTNPIASCLLPLLQSSNFQ